MELIRYCDDFVVVCQNYDDAERFLELLKKRFSKFGLHVSQDKTSIVNFGRKPWQLAQHTGNKVSTFDFLGFTHYCKASGRGYFVMGHKTSKKSFAAFMQDLKTWLKRVSCKYPLKIWWKVLKAKMTGYYNYFAINGNIRAMTQFYHAVNKMVFKWINRRSQRKSMTWEQYRNYLEWNPLPKPKVYHKIYSLRRM